MSNTTKSEKMNAEQENVGRKRNESAMLVEADTYKIQDQQGTSSTANLWFYSPCLYNMQKSYLPKYGKRWI